LKGHEKLHKSLGILGLIGDIIVATLVDDRVANCNEEEEKEFI